MRGIKFSIIDLCVNLINVLQFKRYMYGTNLRAKIEFIVPFY